MDESESLSVMPPACPMSLRLMVRAGLRTLILGIPGQRLMKRKRGGGGGEDGACQGAER